MQAYAAAKSLPGVDEAACVMGTDRNREMLASKGLLPAETDGAGGAVGPDDLLIVLQGRDAAELDRALAAVDGLLAPPRPTAGGLGVEAPRAPRTLARALDRLDGANLALISLPGAYAAAEARRALLRGLHVHLFSDNVSIEDELSLKQLARERGLLCMGPDCGTAIIGGAPLGFANVVRRGSVGIVGASGTGMQEATVLLDRLGAGVSHAIGVGGRDLSDAIGGLMTFTALDALERDPATHSILVISKPPAATILPRLTERLRASSKPVAVCFLGTEPAALPGLAAGRTIEDAVRLAAAHAGAAGDGDGDGTRNGAPGTADTTGEASLEHNILDPRRRFVRGLYTGGSLADEAMVVLSDHSDVIGTLSSNVPLAGRGTALRDPNHSTGHTIVDLGDDVFTQGRPHPMIDPEARTERLIRELADSEVAVILGDVVLGYGSHPDPAGALVRGIAAAGQPRPAPESSGRAELPAIVVSVCGTDADPQSRARQEATLRDAGVLVFPSNARAARAAGEIAKRAAPTIAGKEAAR